MQNSKVFRAVPAPRNKKSRSIAWSAKREGGFGGKGTAANLAAKQTELFGLWFWLKADVKLALSGAKFHMQPQSVSDARAGWESQVNAVPGQQGKTTPKHHSERRQKGKKTFEPVRANFFSLLSVVAG